MKYILIMMFIAYGPTTTTIQAEFNDLASCKNAATQVQQSVTDTRIRPISVGCYPKGKE